MEVFLGKTAGFCYGVKNAVNNTFKVLENNETVYCFGELVHNKQVTKALEKKGLKFITNLDDASKNIIIRSHGATKDTYEIAEKRNLKITDLTCPNVLKIHKIAEDFANKNYFIFIVGKKDHPEMLSTVSFCGKHYYIIETEKDISNAICRFKESKLKNVLLIVQTTYSLDCFNKISVETKDLLPNVIIKNTICNATKMRQDETEELSKNVDFMIIIGGKNSSNSTKLYEIAKKNCKNVVFIETYKELNSKVIKKFNKVGIMAGASTPDESINEVIDLLTKV